ncbi:hypothetical protein EC957_010136 [Mortierella hygrophila]|uniref:Uncharacterized protein n=1 Tax=Mortierella hygrophila TaxID=979708 RepID=A0A9P6K4R5_9FUNG|nr:hypothetical protein EC957_010136 [Mortierella hygrophila]
MSVLLARLRIGIAALLLFLIILDVIYWVLYFNGLSPKDNAPRTLLTPERLILADHILLVLIIGYAAVPRFPTKVPRYARAFVLFVLAVYMLYYHLNNLSSLFVSRVFLCSTSYIKNACGVSRVIQIFGTVAGFLIMYENALTLKETDPNPSTKAAAVGRAGEAGETGGGQPNTNIVPYHPVIQTPNPTFPQQQQFQQQQQQQQPVYYPQQQQPYTLAQQQPLQNATHKFEAQGQAQQQQQFQPQPLYQLNPQQPQQQLFYQPLQPGQQPLPQQQQSPYSQQQQQQTVVAQPMVPGSLVTTTPQPGAQAIAPYTSSGGASVAVSPVLPVGGYSTPSPSVGHQSPVHPPQ